MSDPSLAREREQRRRGKRAQPKRPRVPTHAVFSPDGTRVLAVVHGHNVTPADLDQARQCLLAAPNRTWETEALRHG